VTAAEQQPLGYDVAAIADLKTYPDLLAHIESRLAAFECARSPHLQEFARGGYRNYERHGHSRTYVFMVPSAEHEVDVPAIFSVGQASLDFSKATASHRKRLMGNYSQEHTGGYLIAELARADGYSSRQLPGRVILEEAMAAIHQARRHVGGRFVLVDSQELVAERLYAPYGFRRLALCDPPRGMEQASFVTSVLVIKGEN